MAVEGPQVSSLLRLHSTHRWLDSSLFRGLCCQPRPRLSDILRLFLTVRVHFSYYKIIYYGAVSQSAFGVLGAIMFLVHLAGCGLRGHHSTRTELQSSQRGDSNCLLE